MTTIPSPKSENKVKDQRRLDNSAIYPINGGPIKKPKKLMLDTKAIAIPGGMVGCFPAKL